MQAQDTEQQQIPKELLVIQNALSSPNTPKLYVNGFVTGQTQADVFVVLQLNGNPTAVLNMSFTKCEKPCRRFEKLN